MDEHPLGSFGEDENSENIDKELRKDREEKRNKKVEDGLQHKKEKEWGKKEKERKDRAKDKKAERKERSNKREKRIQDEGLRKGYVKYGKSVESAKRAFKKEEELGKTGELLAINPIERGSIWFVNEMLFMFANQEYKGKYWDKQDKKRKGHPGLVLRSITSKKISVYVPIVHGHSKSYNDSKYDFLVRYVTPGHETYFDIGTEYPMPRVYFFSDTIQRNSHKEKLLPEEMHKLRQIEVRYFEDGIIEEKEEGKRGYRNDDFFNDSIDDIFNPPEDTGDTEDSGK